MKRKNYYPKRHLLANSLLTMMLEILPPPPKTLKEIKVEEDIAHQQYLSHDHFELSASDENKS